MEQNQKKRLEYILIGILLIVSLIGSYFGITLPAPDVPLVAGAPGTRGTISRTGIIDANGDGLVTWNGGNIATYSDAGATETFSITGSSGAFATDSTISQTQVNAAGGSANPYDYTGTLGIMNGSDDFTLFDVNITNANHTGASNTVQALDVAAITGDADATETALKVGDGWDFGADLGNGGLTTSGQAIIGGGYGSTGATISAAGVGQFNGAVTTDGALTADSGAFGGGYGATGASISNAGVGQFNGALTTDGALTADSAVIGGGYGATGCTASTAGALSCDGLLTGALGATVTGATVSLNASSNFGVNIGTGTNNGAVAIGGGSGTVAIDTTTWDVSTAGAVTGIGDITAITALAGGWDVSIAAAAADTAAGTFDVTGQAGGTASADQVGKNGGSVTITAGAGSAKNGAGATDGDGGDVVLLGGARGGATGGTEVHGIVRVGNPTVGSTKATNMLGVEGPLEVDGATRLDGTLAANSSTTFGGGYGDTGATVSAAGVGQFNGALTTDGTLTAADVAIGGGYGSSGVTISSAGVVQADGPLTIGSTGTFAGDVTISPAAGNGNGGLKSELSGLARVRFAGLGAGTNPAGESVFTFVDDSPTGECAPVDGNNTEAEGSADGVFRIGASSYKSLFDASAAANDGFLCTFGADSFEPTENAGLWLYPSVTIASGDLQLQYTDDGGTRVFNIGALTANTWNWTEVDITALAAGTGDAITAAGVTLTAQGEAALDAFNLYLDQTGKWATADSDTLGVAIIQDGVLSIGNFTAGTTLTQYTDYYVREISGNDAVVWITDQSAALILMAIVAY